jgi:hypothetical protein
VASDVPFGIVSGITPLSLAAGFRPARSWLLRRAFASKKPDSVLGAVLHFRRPLSCPTTNRNIRALLRNPKEISNVTFRLSTVARKQLTHHDLVGA